MRKKIKGMKIAEIINYLDFAFQPELQEEYDNSGFLIGDPMQEASGALVGVDVTPKLIEEAKKKKLNLIVTHHPMIFGGIKRIIPKDNLGKMIFDLIENKICVYAAHTNLDNLKNGVNHMLAEKLGMTDCHILHPMDGMHSDDIGAGMIGKLPSPMATMDFLNLIKDKLNLSQLRCSEICHEKIRKVAICGGSGSFLIGDALKYRADIFVTADLKYHDFQRAENRIILCDAGHYETEQFTKELIYSTISKKFRNFVCQISDMGNSYIRYI